MKDEELRLGALSATLRPGIHPAISDTALHELRTADVSAIHHGLMEREASDHLLTALLRHQLPEVRGLTAVELGPPNARRFELSDDQEVAWEDAIGSCLAYLAAAKPEITVTKVVVKLTAQEFGLKKVRNWPEYRS